MKTSRILFASLGIVAMLATVSHAAWVLNIDIDNADDGPITYNPNFSFGGDTTTASTSSASAAVGHNGADSLFGGDGTLEADTYIGTYTPAVDGNNVNLFGVALNDDGNRGGPFVAGGRGRYDVYATWPITNNTNGDVNFRLNDGASDLFAITVDQNTVQGFVGANGNTFAGGEWIYLGSATLDANTTYSLIQEATANTFVSMRASGYLFDRIPEPTSMVLVGLGALGLAAGRRQR